MWYMIIILILIVVIIIVVVVVVIIIITIIIMCILCLLYCISNYISLPLTVRALAASRSTFASDEFLCADAAPAVGDKSCTYHLNRIGQRKTVASYYFERNST